MRDVTQVVEEAKSWDSGSVDCCHSLVPLEGVCWDMTSARSSWKAESSCPQGILGSDATM